MNYSLRKIANGWLVTGLGTNPSNPMMPGSGETHFPTLAAALEAIANHAEPVLP